MTPIPIGILAGLEGPDADSIARLLTGSFVEHRLRDDDTDADLGHLCLTVDEWRQRRAGS